MTAIPDHAEIYRKLHANRWDHVESARRAREYQAIVYADKREYTKIEETGMIIFITSIIITVFLSWGGMWSLIMRGD